VAPTTLITAVFFFSGWEWVQAQLTYFGLDSTMIDFSVRDYIMRGIGPLYEPVIVAGLAALLALWGHVFLYVRLDVASSPNVHRVVVWVTVITGLILGVVGLANFHSLSVCFAIGLLLLEYADYLSHNLSSAGGRPVRSEIFALAVPGRQVAAAVLVGIGLFTATANYAAAYGKQEAIQMVTGMRQGNEIGVAVYSKNSLTFLSRYGVKEVPCKKGAAYSYRYDLIYVIRSGNQYVLLPESWTEQESAILLTQNDSLLFEFSPPHGNAAPSSPGQC
jgi:hypothetical protein